MTPTATTRTGPEPLVTGHDGTMTGVTGDGAMTGVAAQEAMTSVVYDGAAGVRLSTRPVPVPRTPTDVLVRVRATGICGTDRAILLGEFPASPGVVLGHETTGEAVAIGPAVRAVRPGDRVVLNPTFWCARCRRCRRGLPAHCLGKDGREVGIDCDGAMADFALADERFVHPVPDGLPYRRAALVEPLACVLANLDAAAPRWDDLVMVAGAGPIGTLAALVLAARGTRVCLVERDPVRAGLAAQVLPGAVRVAEVTGGGLAGALETGDRRPDVVVDTTGFLLAEAVGVVEDGGAVVVMGERQGARATLECRPLATRGVRVVGAGPYPPHLFEVAIDLATRLPLEMLVTHELPLSRAAEALALLGVRPGTPGAEPPAPGGYQAGKVLLVPDGWARA